MSFTVRIGADVVPVEAGATVPVAIEVANRSDDEDRYEVTIEGVDSEWAAVPVPTFKVDARDVHQEKVFFKPPRLSESLSDDYPFVIRVRSLESGESRTAQGVLTIKPYHHLSMEVSPKKGVISAWRKASAFQVTLMNLGNTEHTVQLSASDPEDALTYEFSEDRTALAPGQTKVVELSPQPVRARSFSGARLHGFSVSARSVDAPSVVCTAGAQLEERPILSPGALVLGFLMVVLFVGWWLLLPKPPAVTSLSLDNDRPMRGDQVTIRWQAAHAQSVEIRVNGSALVQGAELNGEKSFTAEASGMVEAVAYRDGRASPVLSRTFTVVEPPQYPPPKILAFDITPKPAKLGQSILVKYKVSESVTDVTLSPAGIRLDPKMEQQTITADVAGEITYELIAKNAGGEMARKQVKVKVVEASKAAIIVFKAEPAELPEGGGAVKITWQVENGVRWELSDGTGTVTLDSGVGEREIIVSADTELTLTAYDDQARPVLKKLKIDVAEPPSEGTGGEPKATTTGGG